VITNEQTRESESRIHALSQAIERERDEETKKQMQAELAELEEQHRMLTQQQTEELRNIALDKIHRGLTR